MMQLDLFLSCILICLGAMLGYIADEQLALTPRISAWLERILGQG